MSQNTSTFDPTRPVMKEKGLIARLRLSFARDIAPQGFRMALVVFIVSIALVLLSAFYVRGEIETAARNEFDFICNEIRLNIADRLSANALVLYSGSAFFDASDGVSRAEWQVFTDGLRVEQQMPGTQGIGFSLLIPPEQLEQHIQQIRAEGFPDYTVQPPGEREVYSSIVYLEPFTGRNLRAFGYDMFSEPVRRAAMERARDENSAALTGKVILVQETSEDVQAGTLIYVPVYRHGMPVATVEERRAALQGWVYSPYRMDDLMRGTLGNYELKQQDRHITLQIYDGEVISPETLLYDSRDPQEKMRPESSQDLSKVKQVSFFERTWTLKFTQIGGISSLANYFGFWLVLGSGSVISILLFWLIISILQTSYYLESIKRLADTDELTGVFNRRKILELAESELVRAKRQRHPLTLLMIDLNSFKQINDNHGHAMGDLALRLTAAALQNALRKEIDRIGRFGGDEFIILLPEIDIAQVETIAARLRDSVAQATQNMGPGLPPVSLSIGASELDETTQSLHSLVDKADHAMYADKKQQNSQAILTSSTYAP